MKKLRKISSVILLVFLLSSCSMAEENNCIYTNEVLCNATKETVVTVTDATVHKNTNNYYYLEEGKNRNTVVSILINKSPVMDENFSDGNKTTMELQFIEFNSEGEAIFEAISYEEEGLSEHFKRIQEIVNMKKTLVSDVVDGKFVKVKYILGLKDAPEYEIRKIAEEYLANKPNNFDYTIWFYHESELENIDSLPYSIAMVEREQDKDTIKITMVYNDIA